MQTTLPLFCAIATFVLISDHLRIIAAAARVPENPAESSQIERVKRDETYTTEFDDFDVERVLRSERLIKSYIKCLLDQGPCTREGRELKKYVPDALQTDCKKCSERQKKLGGQVLTFVLQNYRSDWDLLVAKYDPDGNFRKHYGYDEDDDNDDEGDEARRK